MLIFKLFGVGDLLGFIGFLGIVSLFGLLCFLFGLFGFVGSFLLFGFLSRLFFLLFRSFYSFLFLLLDLFLLQLFDFCLSRSGFLRLTGNLLVGLGSGLALGLELIERCLNDRLGFGQIRSHGKADEQHAENQNMQCHGPDTGPEVAFRGGRLSNRLHQGASVIKPTFPTPAFCSPPIVPMTEP